MMSYWLLIAPSVEAGPPPRPRRSADGRRLVAAASAALALGLLAAAPAAASDDDARRLADLYRANRDAFPTFVCTFTMAIGGAQDVQEALARGPQRKVTRATGVWARHNGVERYELNRHVSRERPAGPPASSARGGYGVPLPPRAVLRGPEWFLRIGDQRRYGNIGRVESPPRHRADYTTWNMAGHSSDDAMVDPCELIAKYLGSEEAVVTVTPPLPDGPALTKLDIAFSSNGWRWQFLCDESRGGLPVETTMTSGGKADLRAYITEIRACSGGRWFPTRLVMVSPLNPASEGVYVREIKVDKLEADRTPTVAELSVDLPAGATLGDPRVVDGQFRLERPQKVSYDELAKLVARAHQVAQQSQPQGLVPVTVATAPARDWRPWIIGANVLVVLAVVGYLVHRATRS
jgi:hypothetical protein